MPTPTVRRKLRCPSHSAKKIVTQKAARRARKLKEKREAKKAKGCRLRFPSSAMAAAWNPKLSVANNYKALGLLADPNSSQPCDSKHAPSVASSGGCLITKGGAALPLDDLASTLHSGIIVRTARVLERAEDGTIVRYEIEKKDGDESENDGDELECTVDSNNTFGTDEAASTAATASCAVPTTGAASAHKSKPFTKTARVKPVAAPSSHPLAGVFKGAKRASSSGAPQKKKNVGHSRNGASQKRLEPSTEAQLTALVDRHGDDVRRMVCDSGLNPRQWTEAQLLRMLTNAARKEEGKKLPSQRIAKKEAAKQKKAAKKAAKAKINSAQV